MASQRKGIEIQIKEANVAFLLVHGFCAAPNEMATLAQYLAERNISSFSVQVSGHNSSPEEMLKTKWQDWYDSVVDGFEYVKSWNTEFTFVAGISMGGALSVLLASEHDEIDGLILIAPALKITGILPRLVPFLKHVMKYRTIDIEKAQEVYDVKRTKYSREPVSAYHELFKLQKVARSKMGKVACPTLIIQGTADKTINPNNGQLALDGIGSKDKQLYMIEGGEHVITCHSSRFQAYPIIEKFINRITQNA